MEWDRLVAGVSRWTGRHGFQLYALSEAGSSNTFLLQRPELMAQPAICLVHAQTAGRGTRGRSWHAEPGCSLTFSVSLPMVWSDSLAGLAPALGIALVETLARVGLGGVGLKWPNDLLLEGRKLGGILVETRTRGNRLALVVGVGMNLDHPRVPCLGRKLAALSDLRDLSESQQASVAALLVRTVARLLVCWPEDRSSRLARWPKHDVFLHRSVRLTREGELVGQGISAGIDENGRLQIQTRRGIKRFVAGEVTVRLED